MERLSKSIALETVSPRDTISKPPQNVNNKNDIKYQFKYAKNDIANALNLANKITKAYRNKRSNTNYKPFSISKSSELTY